MTRKEAGPCPSSASGRHNWLDLTTKDSAVQEYTCGACRIEATEPLRSDVDFRTKDD